MRTNQRAAVVITRGGEILLINRTKGERNYYVLPGGGVESEETPEQGAIREMKEELSIDISIKEPLITFENQGQTEYYFLAEEVDTEVVFIGDTNQATEVTDKEEWVSFANLSSKNLFPEKIKEILLERFLNK